MRGDFLANSDFIVSKHGDSLMFLQLTPNYDLCQVPVNMKIIDICLHNNNIFLLHENSVSYYNLETKTLKENVVVLSSKPVSMEVNHHVVAILDTFHDIFLFNMSGNKEINNNVMISLLFLLHFRNSINNIQVANRGSVCQVENLELNKNLISENYFDSNCFGGIQLYL